MFAVVVLVLFPVLKNSFERPSECEVAARKTIKNNPSETGVVIKLIMRCFLYVYARMRLDQIKTFNSESASCVVAVRVPI